MPTLEKKRVLGNATYRAFWIQRSFGVRVRATGVLPCANYSAGLTVRPERVSPPMWDMTFWVDDYCLRQEEPFVSEVETWWDSESPEEPMVSIRDANGEHLVPIEPDPMFVGLEAKLFTEVDTYNVYSLTVSESDKFEDCRIVPKDWFVSAIYTLRFGPAPLVECEEFVAQNCSGDRYDWTTQAGGEIPWPLYPDLAGRE